MYCTTIYLSIGLEDGFTARYVDAVFIQLSDRIQYDSCHCGVWCAVIAECFIDYIRFSYRDYVNPALFVLSHPEFIANAECVVDREKNTSFIVRRRQIFSALV